MKTKREKKDTIKDDPHGIEKYLDDSSPVPHQAHKHELQGQRASSILRLCVDQKWYVDCGNREIKNQAQTDCRATNTLRNTKGEVVATNRSKVSGGLEDNIKDIDGKLLKVKTSKERTVSLKASCYANAGGR